MPAPASATMSKKASPFLADEASVAKKRPVYRPKPASGMIAALQDAKVANRETDRELQAMAARIAALQDAESKADSLIQQARLKAEKLLHERAAANQVEYIHADGAREEEVKKVLAPAARKPVGASSRPRAGSTGRGREPSATSMNPTDSTGRGSRPGTRPIAAKGKTPMRTRSHSDHESRQAGGAGASSYHRGAETSSPSGTSAGSRNGRSMSTDRRRAPRQSSPKAQRHGSSREPAKLTHSRKRSDDKLESTSARTPPNPGSRSSSGRRAGIAGGKPPAGSATKAAYIHPALLDSDSDDDDAGPSIADALSMPGLGAYGESIEAKNGLDGLQDRYADDGAQPLQAIMDAAKAEVQRAEREVQSRLELVATGGAAAAASEDDEESFGCVAELGAGAWG